MRQLLLGTGMAMMLAAAGTVEAQNGRIPENGLNGAPRAAQDPPTQERDGYSVAPVGQLGDTRPRTYEENGGNGPDPQPDCCEELRRRVEALETRVEDLETKHDRDTDRLEGLIRNNADAIATLTDLVRENRMAIRTNTDSIQQNTNDNTTQSDAIRANREAIGENGIAIDANAAAIRENFDFFEDIAKPDPSSPSGRYILDLHGNMQRSSYFRGDFYASRATNFRMVINNTTRPLREFDILVNGTRWRVRAVPRSFVPLSEGPVTIQIPGGPRHEIWSGNDVPRFMEKDTRGYFVEIRANERRITPLDS